MMHLNKIAFWSLGMVVVIGSVAASVHATIAGPVPEIDSSSFTAGLGLLSGAVMIVRSRLRRK